MTASPGTELRDVIALAVDTLTCFTIPLYRNDKGRPSLCGSGFFVQIGTANYLVSAAHVLDDALNVGLFYYTSPKLPRHLSGAGQPPYPDVRRFPMDSSYLQPAKLPRRGKNYVIIGYLFTKNRIRVGDSAVVAAPYAYRSDSIPEEEYGRYGVSPETHVVLPLDRNSGFDSDGRRVNIPKPQGMSGGPVTVLYGEGTEDSRVFPVVAVGIEYRERQNVLIATDARYVLEAILNAG